MCGRTASNPTRSRFVAIGDPADPSSGGPRCGGIKPDHEVSLSKDKHESLGRWFFKQELPFEASMLKEPAPEDAQLAKAIQVLKARLQAAGQVGKTGKSVGS